MAARKDEECSSCEQCVLGVLAAAMIAIVVTFIVISCMTKDPVYSVTITGVAGLDGVPAAAANLPSPVFNLTVRIDNTGHRLEGGAACVGTLSTVAVSYEDALLARGSMPEFCADQGKVREGSARAWGHNVDLPPFLRDQLAGELAAGEASVDVKVTTPATYYLDGDTVLVCSKVKIGGGPAAPCRKETVYRQPQR